MATKPPAFEDIRSRVSEDQADGDPVLAVDPDLTRVGADDGPSPAGGVDDPGGQPGEEQSAAEDSTSRLEHEFSLKPDGDDAVDGLRQDATDLTGTSEEEAPEILLGKDRPTESELAERLIGGGGDGGGAESSSSAVGGSDGADGAGSGNTGEGGASGVVTREDVAAAGRGSSGGAPTDPGPPPEDSDDAAPYGGKESMIGVDTHLSGGAPVHSSGGELAPPTQGQQELAKEYGNTWLGEMADVFDTTDRFDPGPNDVVSEHQSSDGSVYVVKFGDGTTVVSDANNNTTTTLHPDGSSDTVDRDIGKTKHTDPPAQPDPENEGADIPAELRAQLDADIVGLRQHTGGQNDPDTETQPAEGDAGFGTGTPTVALSPTFGTDRAHELLGQPGSPDVDFGGGGAAGTAGNPDDGTVDPGEQADTTPLTDGRELNPFDRQQGGLEQKADESGGDDNGGDDGGGDDDGDDGGDTSGVLVPHADLQRVDHADHIRDATIDPA